MLPSLQSLDRLEIDVSGRRVGNAIFLTVQLKTMAYRSFTKLKNQQELIGKNDEL